MSVQMASVRWANPAPPPPAVYELDGPGIDGKIKNFEKPWAMTTGAFLQCMS